MGASRSVLRSLVALGALVFGVGCPGEKGGVGADSGEGETDTDTEPDTHSDTGSDTDTDTQTDSDSDTDTSPEEVDADGDGYPASEDCDDTNPDVYRNETDIMALGIGPACADMLVSARRYGEQEDDGAYAGAGGGDINGDGYDDVLLETWNWKDDTGATMGASYVVLGPVTGDQSLATADARIVGAGEWTDFGGRLDGLGDADGDGYDDIISSRRAGDWDVMSVIFLGPISGEMSIEDGDGTWSPDAYTEVGYAVGAGDVDGDSLPDMVYRVDADAYGRNGAGLAPGPLAGEHTLAEEVAFVRGVYSSGNCVPHEAGDTDRDGFDDIAVACTYSGVALFSGPLSGEYLASEGDATFAVTYAYADRAGDTNGDGYADLTFASSHDTPDSERYRGVVFQYQGPVLGAKDPYLSADVMLVGEESEDWACQPVDGGDLNGDGLDDTLVGASLNSGLGAVYTVLSPVSGTISLSDAWWKVTGDSTDKYVSVWDTLGDTDGDGYADALLGQLSQTVVLPEDGAFYLLRGGS